MMKTKYGKEINPHDFPFAGQFSDYVRKNIDSEWGKEKERELTKKRKYEVLLSASADVTSVMYVDAESEEEAVILALEHANDWIVDLVRGVSVESVEECNSDD